MVRKKAVDGLFTTHFYPLVFKGEIKSIMGLFAVAVAEWPFLRRSWQNYLSKRRIHKSGSMGTGDNPCFRTSCTENCVYNLGGY